MQGGKVNPFFYKKIIKTVVYNVNVTGGGVLPIKANPNQLISGDSRL